MDKNNLLHIGKIVNTFGIKGELKFVLNSELTIKNWNDFKLIFIELTSKEILPFSIIDFRDKKNHLIIKLDGINNINEVERFKNKYVYFNNEKNVFEKKVNLSDYQINYKNQTLYIVDYMFNGVYDLIKIKIYEKEFWVPLVEKYIERQDDNKLEIILKDIEGLM
ncbi:16S rRNA processing protein RimM [Entomoplasma ellychniae]|uniref:Ribosome maturation factor RimM n=2 Tax=Entomoplasmataceae TaxID=33925 RepID=A0A2S5RHN9_9MOLU|nr:MULTISPECIES: 16S rRNA processing protein RimM [Entomoplasmataceae]PPE04642.1 16S rRNA processing protein RimM [Entomoplasma ellychniae]PPE06798.1 16S rRNA processing protein RimM [Mesoplasma corruscae]